MPMPLPSFHSWKPDCCSDQHKAHKEIHSLDSILCKRPDAVLTVYTVGKVSVGHKQDNSNKQEKKRSLFSYVLPMYIVSLYIIGASVEGKLNIKIFAICYLDTNTIYLVLDCTHMYGRNIDETCIGCKRIPIMLIYQSCRIMLNGLNSTLVYQTVNKSTASFRGVGFIDSTSCIMHGI